MTHIETPHVRRLTSLREVRAGRESRLRRAGLFTPTGVIAGIAAVLIVLVVLAGPTLWGDAASTLNVEDARLGPSVQHPFGTDNTGRDVLARMLAAGRLSIGLAVLTAALGALAGVSLGALAGVLGPRGQKLLGEVINLLLAFPGILVALFLTAILGPGLLSAVVALSIASAPGFARLTQTLTSSLSQADFVSAARLAGMSRRRILVRHVLPNVAEPLVLTTAAAVAASLLAFASLSFLGLGIQPPNYDWGRVLSEGLQRLYVAPMAAAGPAVMIVITGMAFNLVGDMLARLVATPVATAPKADVGAHGPQAEAATDTSNVAEMSRALLEIRDLHVVHGDVHIVAGVDLVISAGERVAVVGESGSGKTLMSLAATDLAPQNLEVTTRIHRFGGSGVRDLSAAELGTRMALVFQDPTSSWNPALKMGVQMTETSVVHHGTNRKQAFEQARDLLGSVRISAPEDRLSQYPHQLSGGMRQRAAIASGLMTSPSIIVADEPTTALDVTVQRQVLDVLRSVTDDTGAALLLITHDLGVVAELCERVLVMYSGRIVEDAPLDALLNAPAHPYTAALIATMPDLEADLGEQLPTIPGQQPEPAQRPAGCAFRTRCPRATAMCEDEVPTLHLGQTRHAVACWNPISSTEGGVADAAGGPHEEAYR